jgi:acetoacetyl-CoA synthetase
LFVKIAIDLNLTDELKSKIKMAIRANATPRHVPSVILEVTDIPRTKSGKIAEIAVRDTIHGNPIKNLGSLANPEAIEYYKNLPELGI